jgi:hypothetical protein
LSLVSADGFLSRTSTVFIKQSEQLTDCARAGSGNGVGISNDMEVIMEYGILNLVPVRRHRFILEDVCTYTYSGTSETRSP